MCSLIPRIPYHLSGNFVMYRRIVEELLRLADDTSGAANIDVVSHTPRSILLPVCSVVFQLFYE